MNNGILSARASEEGFERLLTKLDAGLSEPEVDLETQEIQAPGLSAALSSEPVRRTKLLNGWDDPDLPASYDREIAAFAEADAAWRPWARLDEGSAERRPSRS